MDFNLDSSIELLSRTPAVFDSLLRGLGEEWTHCNEGGETWCAFDVIGHLIHGERTDWMPRLARILEHGETKAFDPYDRFAQFHESKGKSLEQLLDEFSELRAANVATLREIAVQPEHYALPGLHPALGPVTLANLLATWTAHDLNHIWQVSRVMARQYHEAVGPWKRYLGVMQGYPEEKAAG